MAGGAADRNLAICHVTKVLIIGAGFAGIVAARALAPSDEVILLERSGTVGGTSKSFCVEGFTFDCGIHGLYAAGGDILDLLGGGLRGAHHTISVRVADLWQGLIAPRPLQSHLGWLPSEVAAECLAGLTEARMRPAQTPPRDYETWSRVNLGDALSDKFMLPYARKFWTVKPAELACDWMGERARVPTIAEAVRGSAARVDQAVHYAKTISYPDTGGFGAYATALAQELPIRLNAEVVGIDHLARTLTLSSGELLQYDCLISTVPMPHLIAMLREVPAEIRKASTKLRATSLALVSLGLRGESRWPYHWSYSFDPDCPFARLSSPSLWSASNAPNGCWSLQAEVYFQGRRPSADCLMGEVEHWMRRTGAIDANDRLVASDVRYLSVANVIHDLDHAEAVGAVRDFLRGQEITSCGRYGRWDYSLVPEVIRDAAVAASSATVY